MCSVCIKLNTIDVTANDTSLRERSLMDIPLQFLTFLNKIMPLASMFIVVFALKACFRNKIQYYS